MLVALRMGDRRARLGQIGEDLAVRELERRGYAVLARRYRVKCGEIDIVAADGPTLVFVEVKAREATAYGEAGEAVTARKRHRIAATARAYLVRHHLQDRPCRFDVVTVHVDGPRPRVEVIPNAFDAPG